MMKCLNVFRPRTATTCISLLARPFGNFFKCVSSQANPSNLTGAFSGDGG